MPSSPSCAAIPSPSSGEGGLFASGLEGNRYLWAARLDPVRRTYAVGSYTHVLDHGASFYDQPIVLIRISSAAERTHRAQLGTFGLECGQGRGTGHFARVFALGPGERA